MRGHPLSDNNLINFNDIGEGMAREKAAIFCPNQIMSPWTGSIKCKPTAE